MEILIEAFFVLLVLVWFCLLFGVRTSALEGYFARFVRILFYCFGCFFLGCLMGTAVHIFGNYIAGGI